MIGDLKKRKAKENRGPEGYFSSPSDKAWRREWENGCVGLYVLRGCSRAVYFRFDYFALLNKINNHESFSNLIYLE